MGYLPHFYSHHHRFYLLRVPRRANSAPRCPAVELIAVLYYVLYEIY